MLWGVELLLCLLVLLLLSLFLLLLLLLLDVPLDLHEKVTRHTLH
jgi:hypothetical protein